MIGAILAQRAARGGADGVNSRDLKKMVKDYAEDATYTFPGHLPISGVHRGKDAIGDFFTQMLEHLPDINIAIADVFVSDICAMGPTNTVAIEYDVDYTSGEGKKLHNSGVTAVRVRRGKIVRRCRHTS